MNFGTPTPDSDELRLRQLDDLLRRAEEAERAEAARRAEEEARRTAFAASQPLDLEHLRQRRDELARHIDLRQHHAQREAERAIMRRRAENLEADAAELRQQLARAEGELSALREKLEA